MTIIIIMNHLQVESVGPFNVAVYRCLGVALPAISIIIYRGEVHAHRHDHNFYVTIDTTVIIDIMFRSAPSAKREEVNLADKRGSRRSFNCCPVLWHEAHAHRYHKKSTMILFSLLSTADANMISAASPIWTAIMARFILKEKQLRFLLMDSHLSVHSSLFRSLLAS